VDFGVSVNYSNLDATLLIFYENLDKKFNNYPNLLLT